MFVHAVFAVVPLTAQVDGAAADAKQCASKSPNLVGDETSPNSWKYLRAISAIHAAGSEADCDVIKATGWSTSPI
jgi:hypothetical protein